MTQGAHQCSVGYTGHARGQEAGWISVDAESRDSEEFWAGASDGAGRLRGRGREEWGGAFTKEAP